MRRPSGHVVRQAGLLAVGCAVLVLVCLLSIAVGTRYIPPGTVFRLLLDSDDSDLSAIVHSLRLPRTFLGMLVGAALGVAGALMQSTARNPLADPGLLGINAGAAVAMVTGYALLGTGSTVGQMWWAFAGAAAASALVYALGTQRHAGPSPTRLVLAGAAVSAALLGVVQGMILLDPIALDRFRFWAVGALAGRESGVVHAVAAPIVIGLLMALLLGRSLNALALGEDSAQALGVHVARTRVLTLLTITLLCGAATAAAGPISFIGLVVPHLARRIAGPEMRGVVLWCLVLGPVLLLGSDVLGRVVDRPSEVQVGVVAAFLGAPLLIAITRRAAVVR